MFFRKSISVMLASMLLFLNLGLGVIAHYCKGELAEISSFYSVAEDSCEMQADLSEKKSCCAKETLIPDSCCENEVISFEENQPKITEFVSFDFFSPAVLTSYAYAKSLDITMVLNGVLAGLVAVTAGADVVSPLSSIIMGVVGGILVVIGVVLLDKLKIDDPVGAVPVHLINGVWGTLAVGIFSMNPEHSFMTQLIGVASIGAFVVIASVIIVFIMKVTVGIRIPAKEEMEGLDMHEHNMDAYPDFRN